MRRGVRWWGIIAAASIAAAASGASARSLRPNYDGNLSLARAEAALGSVDISVDCPDFPADIDNLTASRRARERSVRITLPQTIRYREPDILGALLWNARRTAWDHCPLTYNFFGDRRVEVRGGPIDIYVSGQSGLEHAVHVDDFDMDGFASAWDRLAERAQEETRLREEQERADVARQLEEQRRVDRANQAQARADRQFQRQQARRRNQQFVERQVEDFFSAVFTLLGWIVFLGLSGWAFFAREEILTWFYGLQPHPAQGMVDSAINAGAPIDGGLYQLVIQQTGGGTVENKVRTRQASELSRRLRDHERVLRAESERKLQEERARVDRENAFARAHVELMRAGVSHEEAAARLAEIKRTLG